jgi:hypothetical protein
MWYAQCERALCPVLLEPCQQVSQNEAATTQLPCLTVHLKHTTHWSHGSSGRWLVLLFKPLFSQTLLRVVGCLECGGINVLGELASSLLMLALRCVCSHSCGLASTTLHGKKQCILRYSALCFASLLRPVKHAAGGMLIGNAYAPAAFLSFGPFGGLQLAVVQLFLSCVVCVQNAASAWSHIHLRVLFVVSCLSSGTSLWHYLTTRQPIAGRLISRSVYRQQLARRVVLCCVVCLAACLLSFRHALSAADQSVSCPQLPPDHFGTSRLLAGEQHRL